MNLRCLLLVLSLMPIITLDMSGQKLSEKEALRMAALLDSAAEYKLKTPKKSMEFVLQILETAPEQGNEELLIKALNIAANCQKMQSATAAALHYVNRSVQLSERIDDKDLLLRSLFMKATVFDQNDIQDSSLIYYQKTIDLAEHSVDPYFIASSYTNVGQIYTSLANYEKAEEYILKGYRLSQADDYSRMFALASVISFYARRDDPRYLPYLDTMAMSSFYQKASPESFMAHFDSFLQLEDAPPAEREQKLREVYAFSKENSSLANQVGFGMKLYEFLNKSNRLKEAHDLLLELYDKSKTSGNAIQISGMTRALYQNAKARGDLDEALAYLEEHGRLREQLLSAESTGHIAELNIKFETAQKDHEIEQQRIRIDQEKRNRQFTTLLAVLIGALAVVSFIYFRNRARSAHRIAEQDKVIHRQETERLEKEKELAALASSLETQERERNRIARDLHDGIGSMMSGISAHIEFLRSNTANNNANQKYLSELRDMVKDTTSELRRTSYELMPAKLLRQGLEPAIRDLCINQLTRNRIECNLEFNAQLEQLDSEEQLTLYRIIQELLTNIVRHAAAKNVLIQFTQMGREFSLVVEDDGRGFDVSHSLSHGGLGLGSLHNRVNTLNGFLDIASATGEGTTVTINFTRRNETAKA